MPSENLEKTLLVGDIVVHNGLTYRVDQIWGYRSDDGTGEIKLVEVL